MALDVAAPMPDAATIERIYSLQEEFAYLSLESAPLLAEAERKAEILVELHPLGARVDGTWVNGSLRRSGMPGGQPEHLKTQQQYDAW